MNSWRDTLLEWPLPAQVALAAAIGLGAFGGAGARWWQLQSQQAEAVSEAQRLQGTFDALPVAPSAELSAPTQGVDPRQWPPRRGIDALVRAAAEAASADNDVALKRLSVSHVAQSEQQPGHVQVEVEAAGHYAALKAWQAALQLQLPTATVQQLRWQGAQAGGIQQPLTAQWTWWLWVRDEGTEAEARQVDAATDPSLRPLLEIAARDPFGATPPPAPPPVVYVPPPVVVQAPPAPVVPPLRWVTVGRMRAPDGRQWLVGHWGDEVSVTLTEGGRSPRGHRVERITPEALELLNPDTQERQRIALPPPPRFEMR